MTVSLIYIVTYFHSSQHYQPQTEQVYRKRIFQIIMAVGEKKTTEEKSIDWCILFIDRISK